MSLDADADDAVDELYDWDELERRLARPAAPIVTPRGRGGAPAAILAAALWAVEDVVLGEKQREPVVEEVPVPGPDPDASVVVHLVPGDPSASYVLIRDPGW